MKQYDIPLEHFERTAHEDELHKLLIQSGRSSGIGQRTPLENVEYTFLKYLSIHCSTNIRIIANELPPQIYKVGMHEIEIINT